MPSTVDPQHKHYLRSCLPDALTRVFFFFFLQELTPAGISIAAIDHAGDDNPVDAIWGDERPPPPRQPVRVHDMAYAGEAVLAKLAKVSLAFADEDKRASWRN